jgi:hypothetical protein
VYRVDETAKTVSIDMQSKKLVRIVIWVVVVSMVLAMVVSAIAIIA